MKKTLIQVFLAILAMSRGGDTTPIASVTSILYDFHGLYNWIADGEGFDPGTSTALGPDCIEF